MNAKYLEREKKEKKRRKKRKREQEFPRIAWPHDDIKYSIENKFFPRLEILFGEQ